MCTMHRRRSRKIVKITICAHILVQYIFSVDYTTKAFNVLKKVIVNEKNKTKGFPIIAKEGTATTLTRVYLYIYPISKHFIAWVL